MEVEVAELLLDHGVLRAAGDGLLHPFGLRERVLLRAHGYRVEISEGGGLRCQADAEVGEGLGRRRW